MSLCGQKSEAADCLCLKDVTPLRLNAHCDHIAERELIARVGLSHDCTLYVRLWLGVRGC
jgi:hypothetical protein